MRGCNLVSARYCGITGDMAAQDTLIARKRKGPAPTGKGTPVLVRLQPNQLATLDHWIARQESPPSRPEAIRQLIAGALSNTV